MEIVQLILLFYVLKCIEVLLMFTNLVFYTCIGIGWYIARICHAKYNFTIINKYSTLSHTLLIINTFFKLLTLIT